MGRDLAIARPHLEPVGAVAPAITWSLPVEVHRHRSVPKRPNHHLLMIGLLGTIQLRKRGEGLNSPIPIGPQVARLEAMVLLEGLLALS